MDERADSPYNMPNTQISQAYNNEVNAQLVKLIIDQREMLIFIENDLRGNSLNLQTGEYVQTTTPKMNDDGIREVVNLLTIHIGGTTILSTMSEEQIAVMCENLHDEIAILFSTQQERFGLKDEDRQIILTKIMNMVFISLKRATGGLTLNSIAKTTRESYIQGNPQQRKGFLGGLFKNG